MPNARILSAFFAALLGFQVLGFQVIAPVRAQNTGPNDALTAQQSLQLEAAQSQKRVESLDDETLALVSTYNRELERLNELRAYNANMRQLLESQAEERSRLQGELQEIEVVRQAIVPLMAEMVEVLEEFVALDQPMLIEERDARVSNLRSLTTRSDVELAEKYRRLIEAYQIEAEYGQTLEAYETSLSVDGAPITADVLRVGRVAMFYLTLNRDAAGIWDPVRRIWSALDERHIRDVDRAVRIAREQAPPDLIALPLWTNPGADSALPALAP